MKKLLIVFFALMQISSTFSQVMSEWRGIGRSGVYENEKSLLKSWPEGGPDLLWAADSLPQGYASVALAHGKVFVTGIVDTMDVILALDDAGKKLWQVPFGRAWNSSFENTRCTPTIDGDYIYLSSGLGDVACVSAIDGALVWSVNAVEKYEGGIPRFGYSESLLVHNDMVFFTPAGNHTTTLAFNKLTGELVWESESLKDNASYASPLLINYNGTYQLINQTEKYVYSLNPNDGKIIWTFNFGQFAGGRNKRNNQTNTPLFYNNELFITSGYDHKSVMLELNENGSDVSLKWVDSVLDVHFGGVVLVDGYIYGANWLRNSMGNWTCLEWETGKAMYSVEWGNKGSIIAADGMLYCYEEKSGTIGIAPINPNEFKIEGSVKLPYGKGPYWAHPVIYNKKLYMRSLSAVMVYDIGLK